MIFCYILLGYIYFLNSFIFVSSSRCLWNYFEIWTWWSNILNL